MSKLNYLLRCLKNSQKATNCPYCDTKSYSVIETKYAVTKLVRCDKCKLKYRIPKDDAAFLDKFYQTDYQIDVQMMTSLPDEATLTDLKNNCFDKLRDYFPLIEPFVGAQNNKVIDYGCSWGYNVYKLNSRGLDVQGFELSVPRAKYGKKNLGVNLVYNEDEIRTGNSVFYSSHVIEHLANIPAFIERMKSVLTPDGTSFTFCPNGSNEFKLRKPLLYSQTWGELHPSYIDVDFMKNVFSKNPYYITTGDDTFNLEKIKNWDGISQYEDDVRDGFELLVIAKPNILL